MSMLRYAAARLGMRALGARAAAPMRPRVMTPIAPAASQLSWRTYSSSKPQESDEDFDARWEAYFNREDIDNWELKKGLNELYGHDLVPEPKIVVAMLKAARRLDDVAMAIRILEAVKLKAAGNKEVYSYIIDNVKPTLDELGILTPEELDLA